MLQEKFNKLYIQLQDLINKFQKDGLAKGTQWTTEDFKGWYEIENMLDVLYREYLVLQGRYDIKQFSKAELLECCVKMKQSTRQLSLLLDNEIKY